MVLSLYFLFQQWELFFDARGRRLLPNLVKFLVLAVIILYQCFAISAESTIHMNSNIY